MTISVSSNGTARMIYNDDFRLDYLGSVDIKRASHVEPDGKGRWTADMAPVGGPVLGPYRSRKKALEEEIRWLRKNLLE